MKYYALYNNTKACILTHKTKGTRIYKSKSAAGQAYKYHASGIADLAIVELDTSISELDDAEPITYKHKLCGNIFTKTRQVLTNEDSLIGQVLTYGGSPIERFKEKYKHGYSSRVIKTKQDYVKYLLIDSSLLMPCGVCYVRSKLNEFEIINDVPREGN